MFCLGLEHTSDRLDWPIKKPVKRVTFSSFSYFSLKLCNQNWFDGSFLRHLGIITMGSILFTLLLDTFNNSLFLQSLRDYSCNNKQTSHHVNSQSKHFQPQPVWYPQQIPQHLIPTASSAAAPVDYFMQFHQQHQQQFTRGFSELTCLSCSGTAWQP